LREQRAGFTAESVNLSVRDKRKLIGEGMVRKLPEEHREKGKSFWEMR